jgi:hypothetical protein
MDLMQSRAIRVILKILVVFFIGLMAWVVTMLGIFVVRPALVDTYALKFLVGGCYFPDYDNGTPIAPTSWQFQQEAETAVPVEEVKSYYEDVLNPRSKLFAYPNDDRIWQISETGNGDETAYLFSCEIRHDSNISTPDLIGVHYLHATQQVGVYLVGLGWYTGSRPWVNSPQAHKPHQPGHPLVVDFIPASLQ